MLRLTSSGDRGCLATIVVVSSAYTAAAVANMLSPTANPTANSPAASDPTASPLRNRNRPHCLIANCM